MTNPAFMTPKQLHTLETEMADIEQQIRSDNDFMKEVLLDYDGAWFPHLCSFIRTKDMDDAIELLRACEQIILQEARNRCES